MSGFFITGTDTEIGKTYVSSLIIKSLSEDNLKVVGMKPIASGAQLINDRLQNEDALSLMHASNVDASYETVNPYVFEPAVSPHIAAEQAGVEISFDEIKNNYDELNKISDIVIVEGVGGWYAPLSSTTTVADLAAAFKLPIILVVGLRLGCLNHAALTAQAIRQSGLPVAGWIANHVEKDFSFAEKNISTLKHTLNDFPFLGSVLHQASSEKSPSSMINNDLLINKINKP
jgi:dethiobiotin synthetase